MLCSKLYATEACTGKFISCVKWKSQQDGVCNEIFFVDLCSVRNRQLVEIAWDTLVFFSMEKHEVYVLRNCSL